MHGFPTGYVLVRTFFTRIGKGFVSFVVLCFRVGERRRFSRYNLRLYSFLSSLKVDAHVRLVRYNRGGRPGGRERVCLLNEPELRVFNVCASRCFGACGEGSGKMRRRLEVDFYKVHHIR